MKNKPRSRFASLTLLDIAAGIAVTAVGVPALAAPPAPIAAPTYNWTGFYLGAHAGYRWADADFTSPAYVFIPASGPVALPARNENYGLNGGIFGLQGGYNYQFAPQWLIGIEGDWSWGNSSDTRSALITGFDSTGSDGFTLAIRSEVKLSWQATARARVGYVAGPWLLYATGGGAWTHVKWSDAQTLTTTGPLTVNTANWSSTKTLTGWVLGGGVEYMFNPHWIGRVEYLYESFRDFTVPHGFNPQFGNLDLSAVQKVRVGISYKFGP